MADEVRRTRSLPIIPIVARRLPTRDPGGPPPLLLRVTAFSVFFFPASMILDPLGAAGTVPMILALVLMVFWLVSSVLGLHDPVPVRHPGRLAIGVLLFATLLSYAALMAGWTGGSTVATRASADRWLLLLAASAAIILVAGETIRSLDDAMRYVRAILAGALFCCLVAVVQFYAHINPMDWIASAMPGFTYNGGDTTFQLRGALVRVAGSTFTPIELGVVCSMLLPLSIWRLLFDTTGRKWMHALGTVLLVFGIATTISRSGILGLVVAMVVCIPFLPSVARQWAFVAVPFAVVALFLGVPGLISTLAGALSPSASDLSITTRTDNYPRVIAMLYERPWLGAGPGNYLPDNALHILDNQYLGTVVTMGLVGLAGIVAYLVLPAVTAVHSARTARSSSLRALAGAVAGGLAVGAVGSLTFDSLSFPVFALTYPALVGLGGAVWIMTKKEQDSSPVAPADDVGSFLSPPDPTPLEIPDGSYVRAAHTVEAQMVRAARPPAHRDRGGLRLPVRPQGLRVDGELRPGEPGYPL